MKKLFVSLSVIIATGLAPVLANSGDNDPRAEKVFARQFAGAENVEWKKTGDGYLQVNFTLNGVRAMSFFDENAELLGTVRNLFYNQLPLSVMQTIGNRFSGAVIIEVKEITNSDGTSYRVVFERKDKKYTLRLNSMGYVLEMEKTKLKK